MEQWLDIHIPVTFTKTIVKVNHPKFGRGTAYFTNVKDKLLELGYDCECYGREYLHTLDGIKFDKAICSGCEYADRFLVRQEHKDFEAVWNECEPYFTKNIIQTRLVNVFQFSRNEIKFQVTTKTK